MTVIIALALTKCQQPTNFYLLFMVFLQHRQGAAASETLPTLVPLPGPSKKLGNNHQGIWRPGWRTNFLKWMRRDNYQQCRGNTRWL